jgi:hypothetical protein
MIIPLFMVWFFLGMSILLEQIDFELQNSY